MAYNLFAGLVKYSGADYSKYTGAQAGGKLIFAEITEGEHKGKYIYANGVEYKVSDAAAFDELYKYVHETVDASISDLSTNRVKTLEEWKTALAASVADGKVSITGIGDIVTVEGSGYVDVTTDSASKKLTVSIDDGSLAKKTGATATGDEKLATKGYVDEAVKGAADGALKDVSVSATVNDNIATVSVQGVKGDDSTTTADSFTLKGDDYVKVGGEADVLTLTAQVSNSKEAIADASKADTAKLASDFAVKEYVDDKISSLEAAVELKGKVSSADELSAKLKDGSKGDAYVASVDFDAADGKHIEAGDMIILDSNAVAGVSDATYFVVERNLTGAVTAAAALTKDKIVLGDGNQTAKASEYGIGDDSSHTGAEKTVAAEKWVENVVNIASDALETRIDGISLSANSSTASYLEIKASEDSADKFAVQAGVVVKDLADATAMGQGLADAYDVKQAIDAAGGSLTAKDSATANAAEIDLTAAAEGSEVGGLGKVTIKGVDDYVKVEGKTNEIDVSVLAINLADASKGAAGLAIASDVYKELTNVEEAMTNSIATIKGSVGLEEDLSIKWTEGSGVAEDATVKEAIEALAGKTGTVVNSFGGKTGAISIQGSETNGEVNLVMDGSTLKANVVNLDKKISDVIDASIKLLDVSTTEVADKVLVGVSETDGKVASTAASLEVNGVAFTHAVGADKISATIDGDDILVAGDSIHKDSSISKAIADLSTAIDKAGSKIKSIEGETALAGATVNDAYVAVSASAPDEDGKVTLNSSVLLAAQPARLDGDAASATGLATDAYVADAIANALAWKVL